MRQPLPTESIEFAAKSDIGHLAATRTVLPEIVDGDTGCVGRTGDSVEYRWFRHYANIAIVVHSCMERTERRGIATNGIAFLYWFVRAISVAAVAAVAAVEEEKKNTRRSDDRCIECKFEHFGFAEAKNARHGCRTTHHAGYHVYAADYTVRDEQVHAKRRGSCVHENCSCPADA